MEQKNKNILYATLAVAVTTSVFLYLRKRNKRTKASKASKSETVVKKAKEKDFFQESKLPQGVVGFGSKGEDVKSVQRYINVTCPSELKQLGLYPLEVCGNWGENTEKASISCSSLKRNTIDVETLKRIKRDLGNIKFEQQ